MGIFMPQINFNIFGRFCQALAQESPKGLFWLQGLTKKKTCGIMLLLRARVSSKLHLKSENTGGSIPVFSFWLVTGEIASA
jgi:hypothetical protein